MFVLGSCDAYFFSKVSMFYMIMFKTNFTKKIKNVLRNIAILNFYFKYRFMLREKSIRKRGSRFRGTEAMQLDHCEGV